MKFSDSIVVSLLLLLLLRLLLLLLCCSGVYDILVGGKKVGCYDNTGSFGELALMYNMPRAATIIATAAGNLWAMVSELSEVYQSSSC